MTKILLTYRQHGDDVAASWAITSNLCLYTNTLCGERITASWDGSE